MSVVLVGHLLITGIFSDACNCSLTSDVIMCCAALGQSVRVLSVSDS